MIIIIKSFNSSSFIQSLITYLGTGIPLKSNKKYKSNRFSCAIRRDSLIFDDRYPELLELISLANTGNNVVRYFIAISVFIPIFFNSVTIDSR